VLTNNVTNQLDLIYFVCGLAFFLIGGLSLILRRRSKGMMPWGWLGLFAFCQAIYAWLYLPILSQEMLGSFSILRLTFLFFSFIFLIEFGRAGTETIRGTSPGRWIYFPLAGLALSGQLGGLAGLYSTIPFVLGLAGSIWGAWTLFQAVPKFPQGRNSLTTAGAILVSLALTFCILEKPGSFFPANLINSDSFAAIFGFPVQLVQVLLAVCLAADLWNLCQISMAEVTDARIRKIYYFLTTGTAIGLIFLIALGSLGINYLGLKTGRGVSAEHERVIQRLKEITNNEIEKTDRLVQLLAGSNKVYLGLILPSDISQIERTNEELDRYSQAEAGYNICYLLDMNGNTIASSNRNQPDSFVGKNFGFRPYFKQALFGMQGRYFAMGATSMDLGYYSSCPIRNNFGGIVGVVVIKKSIRTIDDLKKTYASDSLSFLVDPQGIVVLSNQTGKLLSSLWPLEESARQQIIDSKQFGKGPFPVILDQVPAAGKEYQIAGLRLLTFSEPISMEGWTWFHFGSTRAIALARLIGIGILLALGICLISFYVFWDLVAFDTAALASPGLSRNDLLQVEEAGIQKASKELTDLTMVLEQHQVEAGLLSEMLDLLQGCRSFPETAQVITQYMSRLFSDFSGAIYLTSGPENNFEIACAWGESPPEEQLLSSRDCWALRRGSHYLVEDTANGLICQHLPTSLPASYQCIPLVMQSETLGLLHIRQGKKTAVIPDTLTEQQKKFSQRLLLITAEYIIQSLEKLKLQETKRLQDTLDPITGLFNRRYMEEVLEREITWAIHGNTQGGIIIFSLENFKEFSDSYGKSAGQTVLHAVGDFLKDEIHKGCIPCRYGSSEFILILPDSSFDTLHRRAEEIYSGLKRLGIKQYGQLQELLAISLDVASFPEQGATTEALLKIADTSLNNTRQMQGQGGEGI
jgi:diguanylate cyclase (GGDEF)-like protein